MRPIITISLLAVSLLAHAETYRWVDPATGRTVISDTPPPRSVKDVSKAKDSGSNPEGQSYAALKAAENFPVTLYTAASCIAECKAARDLLNGRGVPFTEKMIQTDEDQEALKIIMKKHQALLVSFITGDAIRLMMDILPEKSRRKHISTPRTRCWEFRGIKVQHYLPETD